MKYITGFIFFCIVSFSACKINYSFTGTDKGDAKTATVSFFTVNAPLAKPNTGQMFTEALRDMIQNQGKLNLTTTGGDLLFEGSISGYSVSPVAMQSNDISNANRLTISVTVKFINKKDASKNFENNFTRFADFESTVSLSSVEDELIKDITNQLVQDIFNRALGNW